jgi:hypothetical protein
MKTLNNHVPKPRAPWFKADLFKMRGARPTAPRGKPLPDDVPQRLVELLRKKRPYQSDAEAELVNDLLRRYPDAWLDGFGNVHCIIGDAEVPATTLFLSHTDTVHAEGGVQNLMIDENGELMSDADCLGADDGAGIYLMERMIAARTPGHYLFCRGEEVGAPGSVGAATYGDWQGYQRCVAFDRAGATDVITHHAGVPCCSDVFAWALADALNAHGLAYSPSAYGVFSDSHNFRRVIPECANLSVGYYHQHTPDETLDYKFLETLIGVCCRLDWARLPTQRGLAGSDARILCMATPHPGRSPLATLPGEDDPLRGVDREALVDRSRHELLAWIESAASWEILDAMYRIAEGD